MSDYSELKRLAESFKDGMPDWDDLLGLGYADYEYAKAANPAAVLALIAEVERLQRFGEAFQNGCVDIFEAGMEIQRERDQLKAEVEALRKDSERLKGSTAFVKRLCDSAGKQPSVATGYLHDILVAMSKDSDQ